MKPFGLTEIKHRFVQSVLKEILLRILLTTRYLSFALVFGRISGVWVYEFGIYESEILGFLMQSTIRLTDTLSADMLEVSTFSTYFWILKKDPFLLWTTEKFRGTSWCFLWQIKTYFSFKVLYHQNFIRLFKKAFGRTLFSPLVG